MADLSRLDQESLRPFTREIAAGKLLFRQGELGDTMYMIIEGIVQLFDETPQGQRMVGTFGPGEFFGEKALLKQSPHQRLFSAQAMIKTKVLQFRIQDIAYIQQHVPEFMLICFRTAVHRLEKAYQLIRVLKSPDEMEKLIRCIVFFYRTRGNPRTPNKMVTLTVDELHYLINLDRDTISRCLDELAERNALVKRPDGTYVITSEATLLECIPLRAVDEKAA